jgi:hypothetical protein
MKRTLLYVAVAVPLAYAAVWRSAQRRYEQKPVYTVGFGLPPYDWRRESRRMARDTVTASAVSRLSVGELLTEWLGFISEVLV